MIAAVPELDDHSDGRSIPHDIEAEQYVLGACMLGKSAIDDCIDVGLKGDDFYRPSHEEIWDAIREMHHRGEPVDPLTLREELSSRGAMTRIGGAVYLHTCFGSAASVANAVYYARTVMRRAVRRRLIGAAAKIAQLGYADDAGDVDEIVNAAVTELGDVADRTFNNKAQPTMGDTIDAVLDALQTGGSPCLPTGLVDVDDALIGGLRGVVTVAGRPGSGKTTFGVEVALRVSGRGLNVGYTTLERTPDDLTQVAISNLAKVSYSALLSSPAKPLSEAQWRAVARGAEALRSRPMEFSNRPSASVQDIAADMRHMQRTKGSCALWVIDYLGLMTPADTRVSREQQISRITRELKLLNRKTQIPILLLAQLNREGAKVGREPMLTDLRDSGSIEQDSDAVLLLHRPETALDTLTVLIPKNRRGPLTRFDLGYEGAYQTVGPRPWTPGGAARP